MNRKIEVKKHVKNAHYDRHSNLKRHMILFHIHKIGENY